MGLDFGVVISIISAIIASGSTTGQRGVAVWVV